MPGTGGALDTLLHFSSDLTAGTQLPDSHRTTANHIFDKLVMRRGVDAWNLA
jgi:hypothetical protein